MTTSLVVIFAAGCVLAQDGAAPVLACNLKAFSAAERPRYQELAGRLRAATVGRAELADGFALRVKGTAMTLVEVAEWMGMERRCCPFLTLQLETTGRSGEWVVRMTGPAGVKQLLEGALR